MNHHAQHLFCLLSALFTSENQKASFHALIALFLRGDGHPILRRAPTKSASALSRFLNSYPWNARNLIRHARAAATRSLLAHYAHRRGRRPRLLVMIDQTTLEKTGRFEKLDLVRVLHKKRGVHIVVMYLVAGPLRLPWGVRVWRGKGERSASRLALSLLRTLPTALTDRFCVLVLADGAFGNVVFLEGVKKLELDAVVGMRRDRCLEDGRNLWQARSGEQVTPTGLSFKVTVARYQLRRQGKRETRFVVATFAACRKTIARWGKRRWRIEAFFKTTKSRFGLGRFAQSTRRGAYRFWLLSLLSFVLAQWGAWRLPAQVWPDWREIALSLRRSLLPELVQAELLAELERLRPHLEAVGRSVET